MGIVVSFEDYTPTPRFDGNPWTEVQIEEAPASTGSWTLIDTVALSPLDSDPTNPQDRSFTTDNGTAPDLWYRVIFVDAAADTSLPSPAVQNTEPSASYATSAELFRILKVREPTAAQEAAAERVLGTATTEINSEIDLSSGSEPLAGDDLALAQSVCLDRAADLWRHTESVPGVLGGLDDAVQAVPGRYSWERYAQRLAPLKSQWGLA